jgi:hypothetical protein
MITPFIISIYDHLNVICEKITQGQTWAIKVTLVTLIVSLFMSFPAYERIIDGRSKNSFKPVLEKIDNPLLNMPSKYLPKSHAAKLTFRVTVPLIAKLMNFRMVGCIVLQHIAGILLFYFIALMTERITNDRVTSLLVTLTVGSTYAGIASFTEISGLFDGVAFFFLVMALFSRKPLLIAMFTFLASWTDERALVASSLVLLFHILKDMDKGLDLKISSFLKPRPIALYLSWIAYFAIRIYLQKELHMYTPREGLGFDLFMKRNHLMCVGIWTALEGGWLIMIFSFIALLKCKRNFFMLLFLLSIALIMSISFSVADITRSISYILPCLFIAIQVLARVDNHRDLRVYYMIAFITSLLWQNYYVNGMNSIYGYMPFPVKIMKWFEII